MWPGSAAIPIVGDLLNHTIAPFVGEAIAPKLIQRMFSPQGVSPRFAAQFPMALALRPSQIHAFAEDSAHMISAARNLSERYRSLFPPTPVLAGDADEIVSFRQVQRLHGDVAGSRLEILRGGSHMVHHIAPERVVRAIEAVGNAKPSEGPTATRALPEKATCRSRLAVVAARMSLGLRVAGARGARRPMRAVGHGSRFEPKAVPLRCAQAKVEEQGNGTGFLR
jgi:hypothetical protein